MGLGKIRIFQKNIHPCLDTHHHQEQGDAGVGDHRDQGVGGQGEEDDEDSSKDCSCLDWIFPQ